ncbi:MAG: MCP four helix bundle domain-containing protein, partial [Anaerolineales bacterium]
LSVVQFFKNINLSFIDNLKTSQKLSIGFGLLLIISLGITLLGVVGINNVNMNTQLIYENRTLPIQQIGEAKAALYKLRGDLYIYIFNPVGRDSSKQAIETAITTIQDQMNSYRANSLNNDEKKALADFDQKYTDYLTKVRRVIGYVEKGNEEQAEMSVHEGGEISNAQKELNSVMDNISALNIQGAKQLKDSSGQVYRNFLWLLLGGSLSSIFFSILLVLLITRSITFPLSILTPALINFSKGDVDSNLSTNRGIARRKDEFGLVVKSFDEAEAYLSEMAIIAENIAHGDLSLSIQPKSERDKLGNAFKSMIESLRGMINTVSENAFQLGIASSQLSQTSQQAEQASNQIAITIQQVSKGINQESQSISQTSNSIDQISSMQYQMGSAELLIVVEK